MKKALTVRDIAERAGVSLGTVSRIMNNAGNVAPELRERTLAVIRESNYIPLRRPRRNSRRNAAEGGRIAVLFCDIAFHWNESQLSRSYADGIGSACAAYQVRYEFFSLPAFNDRRFFKQLAVFDGILVKHNFPAGDERIGQLNELANKIPTVGFGMNAPGNRYSQISLDNRAAGALAAEELIRRGHRNIAFINTDPEHPMFISRGKGFREAMERNGLWQPGLFFDSKLPTVAAPDPDPAPPPLGKTLGKILAHPAKATAAVVTNDWGCVGLYRACAERGLKIPDDLSILGFDNQISICRSLHPQLSSIDNPLTGIGQISALELFSQIDAQRRNLTIPTGVRLLSGILIERESILTIQKG